MNLDLFTLVHILICLASIFSGFGILAGLMAGKLLPSWTALFLTMTIATSVTGFFFPFVGFTPAYVVGALSLVLLAIAVYALYKRHLIGGWRKVYVITAIASLYLNVFVLIAQFFQKFPALKALAPTQTEPPFGITQGLVLVVFVWATIIAVKRFRGDGFGMQSA